MAVAVTDAFSNREAHIAEAARVLGTSAQKRAVFEAVYRGKRTRKSVDDLAKATGLKNKQILDAGKPLARGGLFKQISTNPVVYEKIEAIAHIRDRILSTARRHSAPRKSASANHAAARSTTVRRQSTPTPRQRPSHDVFISHASEDKASFVRELAEKLRKAGISVWYDQFSLKWGDGLRETIDRGLASSRFGIVVLSAAFFAKEWPKEELEGLFHLERAGKARILPIWHNVSRDEVAEFSPMLAGRLAVSSTDPIDDIIRKLRELLAQ